MSSHTCMIVSILKNCNSSGSGSGVCIMCFLCLPPPGRLWVVVGMPWASLQATVSQCRTRWNDFGASLVPLGSPCGCLALSWGCPWAGSGCLCSPWQALWRLLSVSSGFNLTFQDNALRLPKIKIQPPRLLLWTLWLLLRWQTSCRDLQVRP